MKPNYKAQIAGQEIGKKLLLARKGKGVSLKALAEATGVSMYAIRNLEGGLVSNPDPDVVRKLETALRL